MLIIPISKINQLVKYITEGQDVSFIGIENILIESGIVKEGMDFLMVITMVNTIKDTQFYVLYLVDIITTLALSKKVISSTNKQIEEISISNGYSAIYCTYKDINDKYIQLNEFTVLTYGNTLYTPYKEYINLLIHSMSLHFELGKLMNSIVFRTELTFSKKWNENYLIEEFIFEEEVESIKLLFKKVESEIRDLVINYPWDYVKENY